MRNSKTTEPNDQLFIVEGTISELHVERGRKNLFEKIGRHYRSLNLTAGSAAVAADLFDRNANSAMLSTYDGEDTQNFACLLDGYVLCGQFAGAGLLAEGKRVKVAASRCGEVFVAHAILCPADGYIWIDHPFGTRAELLVNFRLALGMWLVCMLGWISAMFFFGTRDGFWVTLLEGAIYGGIVCFGVALWASSDMKALAGPSTEMFRILGFCEPERINLRFYAIDWKLWREHLRDKSPSYLTEKLCRYQYADVYLYRRAIDDGRLKLQVEIE